MKVALVVPLDFTAFLCCKAMIERLKDDRAVTDFLIVCDETPNADYLNTLSEWGACYEIVKTPRHVSVFSDIGYCNNLYKIFKKELPDVVISACTKPNIYSPIAAKLAGVKKIFASVWGRGTAFTNDKNLYRSVIRSILLLLYKIAFSFCNFVWFTNPNDHKYFVESKKIVKEEKCFLTKNYIDLNVFNKNKLNKEKILSFRKRFHINNADTVIVLVGRMIWPKGVKEFVEASKITATQNPNIKYWLLGSEEKTSPDSVPINYLKEASKANNFQWLGYQEDILNIYGASDIAVLPSYYREGGYPRALTEPMALEMPVIAADSIDCRAPVEHGYNGYLVPIKDSKMLASYILELTSDDEKRKKFGRNSRIKAVNEYDEYTIIKTVMDSFILKSLN